jgi:hypothetical protein
MNWIAGLKRVYWAIIDRLRPTLRVIELTGDTLPVSIPANLVVRLVDDGDDWSVGFNCPCGCKEVLELMLLPAVIPRWDLSVDARGRPTLHPSVWRTTGCRSHFWIRKGRVVWCR